MGHCGLVLVRWSNQELVYYKFCKSSIVSYTIVAVEATLNLALDTTKDIIYLSWAKSRDKKVSLRKSEKDTHNINAEDIHGCEKCISSQFKYELKAKKLMSAFERKSRIWTSGLRKLFHTSDQLRLEQLLETFS